MTFNPKVSIIIPVYNGANYMREAIDSALAQTYSNIEIIVVNDGSIDGGKTEEIALSYGDKIRYFPKENGGVATALNLGIEMMTGEYFSWLSHDDAYFPHKVQSQIDYLSKLEDKNIILYSDFELINDKSGPVAVFRIKHLEPHEFRLALITGYPIHGCTALIPGKCFDAAGLFDESLKTSQDYDLWFKMSGLFSFVHTPDILVKSRIHAEQGSRTIPNHVAECNNLYINCLKEISTQLKQYPDKFLSAFFSKTALNLLDRGFFDAAAYALQLALQNVNEQARFQECLAKAVSSVKTDAGQPKVLIIGASVFDDCSTGDAVSIDIEEGAGALDKIADETFDLVLSFSAFSKAQDYPGLPEKITRILKPGGVLYIDYEVSPSYWNNTKDYNLYLQELGNAFDNDYLFNFSIEQSSLLNRYYRKLVEVISLRDWKKLIKGILKRVIPSLKSHKQTGTVFAPERYCIDWGKAVQNLSLKFDILTRESYLACRESEVPPTVWGKWNSKLTDSFFIIARKRS